MQIQFSCVCGQAIAVPDELAGNPARCPNCAVPVEIPCPRSPEDSHELTDCGYCGEPIKAAASKCRWCKEFQTPQQRASAARRPLASTTDLVHQLEQTASSCFGFSVACLLAWIAPYLNMVLVPIFCAMSARQFFLARALSRDIGDVPIPSRGFVGMAIAMINLCILILYLHGVVEFLSAWILVPPP